MAKSLAPTLEGIPLPADAAVQTWAFLGRKGSGKTYAAGRLVESLLAAGMPVIVLDPVGNWWGLRVAADGKGPSDFRIPILGGERGDVPLEHRAGAVVADFVVDSGASAILDVSGFRKGQRKEFVADFAEQLFHRKKGERSPLHLVIEEAQVFAPQRAGRGEERMLGAIEDIVRLGRNVGIGASMISQRPQSVNKEVLNQAEPLVVFQLVAKQERDAVARWMEHVGAELQDAVAELPSLETGDCYFWSPAWLRMFQKTRFAAKETFDASSTPTMGGRRKRVQLADVDLAALTASMSESIERAGANDPKKLQAEIARLRKELTSKKETSPEDLALFSELNFENTGLRNQLADWSGQLTDLAYDVAELHSRLGGVLDCLRELQAPPERESPVVKTSERATLPRENGRAGRTDVDVRPTAREGEFQPSKPQLKILDALAWFATVGIQHVDRTHVAAIAGVSPRSSGFEKNVSTLSSNGLISYPAAGQVELTETGAAMAMTPDSPGSLPALHRAWLDSPALSGPQRDLLEVLLTAYPRELTRGELAERVNASPRSSGFEKNVSRLSSLGVAEYPRPGQVRAGKLLFPDGL